MNGVFEEEVRVFAPATVANLGCGYDVMGLAIHGPGDEIIIRKSTRSEKLTITAITGDEGKLPLTAEKNTAGVAALEVLAKADLDECFEMEIHKKMPFGSGLGSSAASAVGGAFAMNEILGNPFSREELLHCAMKGEEMASKAWHADNVSPGLFGGISLIRDNPSLDVVQLPVPQDLWVVVIYNPEIEILTSEARTILPKEVTMNQASSQAGHLASFVSALHTEDFSLMSRCIKDQLAEPFRRQLIPQFENYRKTALEAGAFGFGISGSGPSLFALCHGELAAYRMGELFKDGTNEVYVSKVNKTGVVRIENEVA